MNIGYKILTLIADPTPFILRILLHSVAMLPWAWIQAIGRLLGTVWANVPSRQRRDILINMRLCLPHLTDEERLALCKRSMVQFACTMIELAAMWLWPVPRVLRLIKHTTGTDLLNREPNQGLIVLSPHIGAWELAGLYMTIQGGIVGMYRPQRHLNQLVLTARQRGGAIMVRDDTTGVKRLLRTVMNGGQIGILPDQVTKEETGSTFAPFFGVPAVTMSLVSKLAIRSKAKVIFMFAERLPHGGGFHIHCLPAPPGIDDADNQIAATALNQGIEQCIRVCPEQYQWTYRRFRRRPGQQPNPYVGPPV